MKEFETRSTSSVTAEVSPFVLRQGDRTRLVFLPLLVVNPNDSRHCVKGTFVYQRKTQAQEWEAVVDAALSSLKAGEGYKLELGSAELFRLVGELIQLYPFFKQHGVQYGRRRWVRLQTTLGAFLSIGETELTAFLNSNRDGAAESLVRNS